MSKAKRQLRLTKIPAILFDYFLVLSIFSALRITFIYWNSSPIIESDLVSWLKTYFFGFRLDLIITFYLVTPVFLLSKLFDKNIIRQIGIWLITISSTALSFIDTHYFRYSKERVSYELFWQLSADNNISLISYISDFPWSIILILTVAIFLIVVVKKLPKTNRSSNWVSTILIITLVFFAARGGLRLKPLRTSDASMYVSANHISFVNNTSLYIVESWLNPIVVPSFILDVQPSIKSQDYSSDTINKFNFVIIILESFGKEYTGLNRGMTHTYTPFLNSLFEKSVVCHNAYANGLKSVDAVPALFASIPKLSQSPIIHSPKSLSQKTSLFHKLKKLGYSSSFFHGANNNSMGFQPFLINQGIDKYYGINDYPNAEKDYDGHWGIFDEPYFNYTIDKLSNQQQQPFISGIFSLSSHHPFVLPDSLKSNFTSGQIPIHNSIQYTDYALSQFFEKAKKQSWFNNTIFIITADHSGENLLHAYRTPSGKYEIPLLLYAPKILDHTNVRTTVSHIDVPPTILDLVNYPVTFKSLGKSIFNNSNPRFVYHFDNNVYHSTSDSFNLGYNEHGVSFLYNKSNDINCLTNITGKDTVLDNHFTKKIKQSIANYHYFIRKD